MTITAIDPQRRHVVLMAKRRGLRTRHASVGHIGGALELNAKPKATGQSKYSRVNGSARNNVSAAMENLHRSEFFCTAGFIVQPETVQPETNYRKNCNLLYETGN